MRLPSTSTRRLLTGCLLLAIAGVLLVPARAGAAPAATASSGLLRMGSSGPAVTALQLRLAALRYDPGPADGSFGPQTHHAVVAFQKVHGLARDGVVGPITRGRLASPSTPAPRHPRGGISIEVDLAKQVLYVFSNGTVSRIVPVSTANGELYESGGTWRRAVTPRGSFAVQRYIPGWRQSYLGLLWRPMYFYGGYAIHGSTSVPPYPASHGCIRTPMASQDRLIGSGLLALGRPVYVY